MLRKCEVVERTETWPYVRKCDNDAEYITDQNYDGNFNRMALCGNHADDFVEAFPRRELTKIER